MSAARLAAVWGVLGILAAPNVDAQDTLRIRTQGPMPSRMSQVEQWAVDIFNAQGTTRVVGALRIEPDVVYSGDLAVFEGPLVVEGVIEGTLVAINADVHLRAGAEVGGDVLVLGGTLDDDEQADVFGSMRRYSRRVDAHLVDGRLVLARPARQPPPRDRPRLRERGRLSILLGTGGTYNRVEGLPLRLGTRIEWWQGDVATRIRGYGIFRTAGDFKANREDIGYYADARLTIGRSPQFVLGGRVYDVVAPTQEWPLELNEVGWGTFLWHRDYRDYFLERGYGGFVEIRPVPHVTLAGDITRVDQRSVAARDPWTPFRKDEPWRPNPSIDAGDYALLSARAEFDDLPPRRGRGSGMLVRVQWDRGIGDAVSQRPLPLAVRDPLPTDDYVYDRLAVDVRRYQRIGWAGQLRLRALWAGSIGRDPLPIQARYSLGGPDPLNGYGFRAIACNAAVVDPAQTGLCDRILLFQAEYRGSLSFDWFDSGDHRVRHGRPDDEGDWDWGDWLWFEGPTLVLFSNAATGWLRQESAGSLHFDIGVGLELGGFGLYVAKALQEDEPVRVTLRIERRF